MRNLKTWLLFLLVTVLFYYTSVRFGFSQDDFYFLHISSVDNIFDIFKFFSPWHQQGFPFYRPLGTQLYFYLFSTFFHNNSAQAMHIFMIILQSFTGFQVFLLTRKLVKDSKIPYFVGISYIASAAHFLSLYYIAATQQLLAAAFSFLALNYFTDQKYRVSALFLGMALLSKESAIIVPAVAFLIYLFHQKKKVQISRTFRVFSPFIIIVSLYLLLRFAAGVQVQSEYHPVIGTSLISSLRWYYLFTFNAPELLLSYEGVKLFINFWRYMNNLGTLAIINTISVLTLSIITLFTFIRSLVSKIPLSKNQILLYFQWWMLGIVLIIWFPSHRYPHYLDLALPAMLIPLYLSFKGKWSYLLFGLYLLGAYSGLALSVNSHWTTGRALMSARVSDYFRTHNLCQNSSIYFTGDPQARELSYTLSIQNGPDVLCSTESASPRVYYQGVTEIPSDPDLTIDASTIINQ